MAAYLICLWDGGEAGISGAKPTWGEKQR
jgi:hypothetical protein